MYKEKSVTPSLTACFSKRVLRNCFDESQKHLNAKSSLSNYGSTTVLLLVCFGRLGWGEQLGWRTGGLGCITELMSK